MIPAATASGTAAATHRSLAPWRLRRWWAGLASVVLLTAVGVLLWAPGSTHAVLELRDGDSGEVLHRRPLEVGERFELHHTHSVTRRPVVETFGVDGTTTLTLEGMVFDHPGPNLPTGPERFGERMTSFTTADGVYRVDHHGYPIGRVTIRVGTPAVDHTLVFQDGSALRFLDLTRAGGAIELEVVERSGRDGRD
ncbi:MAG: DUF1850 domain-containing protein [Nitriliruptoraceae bacterium]